MDYGESYFNGNTDGGYTNYSETTYFNENFELLASKFVEKVQSFGTDLTNRKVLVIGCAYGFLVDYLNRLGVNAYGFDISEYAISQSPVPTKVMVGDARLEASFTAAKQMAGLTKQNDKFDLIIDEDMIICLSNAEAASFRTHAMKYSNMFIHLYENSPHLIQWYNWKTITEWKQLLGTSPKEKWYTRFDWSET